MGIFHIIYNHFYFSVKTEIVKQVTEPALAFKADYLEELELLTLHHSAAGSREVGITIKCLEEEAEGKKIPRGWREPDHNRNKKFCLLLRIIREKIIRSHPLTIQMYLPYQSYWY